MENFVPFADIYEEGEKLILKTDMPGVKAEMVDIAVEKNILTIIGRVKPRHVDNSNAQSRLEFGIGDFKRVFTLADEIDREKIEAEMKDGVLRLVLSKSERAKPRKIVVKALN